MEVKKRILHPDQISSQPQLREAQKRLYDLYWQHDLEIYDDRGNLVAITSKDNPNLNEVLANLRDQYDAPGSPR